MIRVTVNLKLDGARNRLNEIKRGLGDRAVASALNKTATQARTRMSALIRADYNISAGLVRERLRIRRAMRDGKVSFEAALIGNPDTGGRKRSMNLVHFLEKNAGVKAYRRGKGGRLDQLRFKIKRHGGMATVPGAFIGNNGRTIFQRVGKERLPINAVQTIGVPQMFNTKKNRGAVEQFIRDAFPAIYRREIAYYTSTVGKS